MHHESTLQPSWRSRFRLFLFTGCTLLSLLIAMIWLSAKWIESDKGRQWLLDHLQKQGITANYKRLKFAPFRGQLTIYDVDVPMPAPHHSVAPSLLTLSRVKLDWSFPTLLTGNLFINTIQFDGAAMHVARDETGRTSLDFFLDERSPTTETIARSRLPETLASPVPLTIQALSLQNFSLSYAELEEGKVNRRVEFSGITARANANLTPNSPASASLSLTSAPNANGSRIKFVDIGITQDFEFSHTTLLTLDHTQTITAVSQIDLVHHNSSLILPTPSRILDLDMELKFDAEAAALHLHVANLSILNGAMHSKFAIMMPDDSDKPILEHGTGELALAPLLALLPPVLTNLSVDQGHFAFQLASPEPGDEALMLITATGTALQAKLPSPQGTLALDDSRLTINGRLWRDRYKLDLTLPTNKIALDVNGTQITLDNPTLNLRTDELHFSGDNNHLPGGYLHVELDAERAIIQSSALLTKLHGLRNLISLELRGPTIIGGLLDVAFESLLAETTPNGDTLVATSSAFEFKLKNADRDVVWPQALQTQGKVAEIRIQRHTGESLRIGGLDFTATTTAAQDRSSALLQVEAPLRDVTLHVPATDSKARLQQIALSLTGNLATDGKITHISGKLPFAGLTSNAGEHHIALDHGRIEWLLSQLDINTETPIDSTVHFDLLLATDGMTATTRGILANQRLNTEFKLDAMSMAKFAEYLPASLDNDFKTLSMVLTGTATWSNLAQPTSSMKHDALLRLTSHSIKSEDTGTKLPLIEVKLQHRQHTSKHTAKMQATMHPPRTDSLRNEEAVTLALSAEIDTKIRSGHFIANLNSVDGLDAKFDSNVTLSADGTLIHASHLDATRLDLIKTLIPLEVRSLPGFESDNLALRITTHGKVSRLLDPAGALRHNWWNHLDANQHLEASFHNMLYDLDGLVVALPHAGLVLDAQVIDSVLTADMVLEMPRLELEAGGERFSMRDSMQTLRLESDAFPQPALMNITLNGQIGTVDQTFYPAYPISDATINGHLTIRELSELSLDDLVFVNDRGGTRLALHKHFERGRLHSDSSAEQQRGGGTRITLRGHLQQDLERIDAHPELLRAHGKVTVPFLLESGDGSLFRLQAELALDDISLTMPDVEVDIAGVQGRILLEEAFEWSPPLPPRIVPHTERNPFARTRFADIQPFFIESNLLTIKRLRWREREAGPITGIAYIDRNIISLQNLKIEKAPGIITGALVVDYLPGAESIHFRGTATGLRSGLADSPLDANAAFVLTPATLEIDGRIQIVRISRTHLHELLDLFDPFREDLALNSLRKKLTWSYPRSVRIVMAQGLMSLQVDLGGLGALFQLGEIRGIPLGHFINRHVAPLLQGEENYHD